MNGIFGILAGVGLVILIFIIGQSLTLWYFKITERIKLQNDQIELQRQTNDLLRSILKNSIEGNPPKA